MHPDIRCRDKARYPTKCPRRFRDTMKLGTDPFRLKKCERLLICFQFSMQMFFAIVGKKCGGQFFIRVW